MKYLELIPILLFVLMIIMDRRHLGKLSQLVKDFEEINSGARTTPSYLNTENTHILEFSEGEKTKDVVQIFNT